MNYERYERQIALEGFGVQGQQRLNNARVLIVGVGGLGAPIATYLCASGVGTLGLCDGDVVSINNLQRQILYTEHEVGKLKVEVAKKRLHALNSNISINTYSFLTPNNAEEIINNYDIVVDGCDNFNTRYLINQVCLKLNKPYIYGAIQGHVGQVSVFGVEKQGVEDNKKAVNIIGTENNIEVKKYWYTDIYPQGSLDGIEPIKAVIGTTPAVVGAVQANEVIKLIVGIGTLLVGKLWTINLLTMNSQVIEL